MRLNDCTVGVVARLVARMRQQRLVDLRVETPGWSLLGEGFARGEFETHKTAVVRDELGHAFAPLGAEIGGQSAEELQMMLMERADRDCPMRADGGYLLKMKTYRIIVYKVKRSRTVRT